MATTIINRINNFIDNIADTYFINRFDRQRATQATAQDEIKFIANHMKNKFGCETSNEWLCSTLADRRGARSLLTPAHRYIVPIYKPDFDLQKPDEYIKRSELYDIMRQQEFKQFIDNLKCSCPKH